MLADYTDDTQNEAIQLLSLCQLHRITHRREWWQPLSSINPFVNRVAGEVLALSLFIAQRFKSLRSGHPLMKTFDRFLITICNLTTNMIFSNFVMIIFLFSMELRAADESPSNTGDLELQQIFISAQKFKISQFSFGEIECETIFSHTGRASAETIRNIHAWWAPSKSRSTIRETQRIDKEYIKSLHPVPNDTITSNLNWTTIFNEGTTLDVNDDNRKVVLDKKRTRVLPPFAEAWPSQWWYGKVGGEGYHWYEVLAPSHIFPKPAEISFVTHRLDSEKLEIVRTSKNGKMQAIISTKSWQVMSALYKDTSGTANIQETQTHYTWDESGEKLVEFRHNEKHRDGSTSYKIYRVKRVNHDTPPPESLFSVDLVQIKDGYFIDDKISKKRYFKGGRPVAEERRRNLENLSNRVRDRGFLKRQK